MGMTMGMTERLEEAQFAVEVAEAALLSRSDVRERHRDDVTAILEADLCRARGVLLAIQRRQERAKPGDGNVIEKVCK